MAPALSFSCLLAPRPKPVPCVSRAVDLRVRQHSSAAAVAARLVTSSTSSSSSSSSKSGAYRSQGLRSIGSQSAAAPVYHEQHRQQVGCLTTAGASVSKSPSLSIVQRGSSEHKPLVQHMLELLVLYEQANWLPAAAVQDAPEQQQQQQKMQELLHSVSLLHNQDLYFWLNRQLQGLKVRTVLGKQGGTVHRYCIAFLDPRSTANIMVPDPCGSGQLLSCFDYITRKFPGTQDELVCDAAGQPLLPCIGVQLSAGKAAAADSSAGASEQRFISYPVEVCWLEQGKVKKGPGGWPPTEPTSNAHAANLSQTSRHVPPWIRAVLDSSQLHSSKDYDTASLQGAGAIQLPDLLPASATAAAPLDLAPCPAAAAATWAADHCSQHAVVMNEGFKVFIKTLLPTKQEKAVMRSTLEAVSRACEQIRLESPDTGLRWNVASVSKAGSFVKATGLTRNGDLDIVLKLRRHGGACFDSCRRELLAAVQQQLGRAAGDAAAASPDAGWRVKSCHTEHFLRLEHPQLQLQLDVQVARYYGHTEAEQRQQLLQPMLKAAEAAAAAQHASLSRFPASDLAPRSHASEGCEYTMNGSSSSNSSYSASMPGRLKIEAVRQRVTDLSESQAAVIRDIDQHYKGRSLQGYGRLVTDVIRAVKAWSKFGLPAALLAGGAAAEECKGPPCYLWEVFVLYVLEQRSGQGRVYDQARPLELFMDVMQQAAQQLRCTDAPNIHQQALSPQQQQQQQWCDQKPIILEVYYSMEQALLPSFSALWGAGRLYRPAIIHPVDPSYNCTAWQPFRQWDELAAAAESLHEQLQQAMQGRAGGGADGPAAAAAGCGGAGVSAWQRLCSDSSCTLGAAVKAFEQ